MSGMLELFRFYSQSADIADANIDTSQLKIVKLNNWCLKFKESSTGKIFHNFCLHIKGYKKNPSNEQDIYWISSEIVEVRSERVLLSKSTAYYLAGEINKKESLAEGFSASFNDHFKNGFPKDWHPVMKVFGDYILKKEASVQQINQQLRIKSLTKNLPSLCYFNRDKFDRRNKDEARLHKFIEKELGNSSNKKQKRKSDVDEDAVVAKRTPLDTISARFRPINNSWTSDEINKLWSAIRQINPCNENDWNKVMLLFGQNRSLEEVKKQAEPMRVKKTSNELVEKLKKLTPGGQLPREGTMRRKFLEDEIIKSLYYRRSDNDNDVSKYFQDEDSDDESMTNCSINPEAGKSENSPKLPPVQYSLLVDSCRKVRVEDENIGNDFSSQTSNSNYKYKVRYACQLHNRYSRNNHDKSLNKSNEEMEVDEDSHTNME